ncbi:hypothetical protein ACFWSF_28855 [Streptomyces sp. NPDC058611]|uniref:hypothetical protein n=1 Tax=unclassified Streptomyces TaxID=2593676 RepID=UPI00364C9907
MGYAIRAAVGGAEGAEHRVGQPVRRAHPGERHEPDPAACVGAVPGGRLEGEPGLARAPGADE